MGNIVVMGGSFNPPTIAHLKLMRAAVDSVNARKGIFVPASNAYVQRKMGKRKIDKNMVMPESIRIKLLETFSLEDKRLEVSNFEMGKESTKTVDTMTEISRLYENDTIYFIIGADKLHIIPRWTKINEFLETFQILVAARDGENPREIIEQIPFLKEYEHCFEIFEVPKDIDEISSSQARMYLQSQNPKAEAMFTKEVWRILTEENAQMFFGIYSFRKENDYLSNFYEVPITYEGITYQNAEAAFQAQKTLDEEEKLKFANLPANMAKRMGRRVALREDWETVKNDIMYEIVNAKFTQNLDIQQRLRNTGLRILTEGNTWRDTYWGVDVNTGKGQNHLGKILMRVREEFLEQ